MSEIPFITRLLAPPGPSICRPEPGEPVPPCNPPIFNDAMAVRTIVFIDEQKCSPESELDDDDARSWHWVMYDLQAENEVPVGVIRLVPPPHPPHEVHEVHLSNGNPKETPVSQHEPLATHQEPYVKLTRVALLPAYRGKGMSRTLVDTVLDWAANHPRDVSSALDPGKTWMGLVLVHAQVQVEELYRRMGFVTDESMGKWEEEGILHVGMWKRIPVILKA